MLCKLLKPTRRLRKKTQVPSSGAAQRNVAAAGARKAARKSLGLPTVARPFALFCKYQKDVFKFKDIPAQTRFKVAGQAWRALSAAQKEPFLAHSRSLYAQRRVAETLAGIHRRGGADKPSRRRKPRAVPSAGETAHNAAKAARSAGETVHSSGDIARSAGETAPTVGDTSHSFRISMSHENFTWTTHAENLLGEGTYGKVFLGRRGCFAQIAVKMFHNPGDAGHEWAALREFAEALGPGGPFVDVYGHLDRGAVGCVFMELCDRSLAEVLRRGGKDEAPDTMKFYVFWQLRRALAYMHSRDTAHLDVKPSNVLWTRLQSRAMLADFSLTERIHDASGRANCALSPPNSLNYRPPEQIAPNVGGRYEVRAATDVWAFGCLLWELGAWAQNPGTRPPKFFPGNNTTAVLRNVRLYLASHGRPLSAGAFVRPVFAYCARDAGARTLFAKCSFELDRFMPTVGSEPRREPAMPDPALPPASVPS